MLLILLVAVLGSVLDVSGHHETVPKWKILFEDHKVWSGFYIHYNRPTYCYIVIHSVALSSNGVAFVTFKDREGANMDFSVYDNMDPSHTVTMKKTTSFSHTITFPKEQEFMAVGTFSEQGSMWIYEANITLPKNKGFETLKLSPKMGDEGYTVPPANNDRSFSLGLAVGIPVTLAVILVITGVGIGVWAVRKGYLRHVPLAYKNFKNPRDGQQVIFQRNGQTEQTEQNEQTEPPEPNNVHI